MTRTINVKGKLIDLSSPKVMGIINLTPDSFYDGGENISLKNVLKKVEQFLEEKAEFIDIGGVSTRPGASFISADEERNRIMKPIKEIIKHFPQAILSVDTFRSEIALEAVNEGVSIINDVMGGEQDEKMFATAAKLNVPYILTHSRKISASSDKNDFKKDLILEINYFFSEKISLLKSHGINDIILDPGFGFEKSYSENLKLIKNISILGFGEYPILLGVSRKSTIQKILKCSAQEALNGTTVLNTLSVLNGASILRVHDVKEARECVKLIEAYKKV